MAQVNQFQIVYLKEAMEFIRTLPLSVATHGFVKKTWKVPAKDITRAKALRKKYYESK